MEEAGIQEKAPVITIDTIQSTLKAPGLLGSFLPDDFALQIARRLSLGEKAPLPLVAEDGTTFFPFFTIYDLKLFLYERVGKKDPRWAPEYQFLAIQRPQGYFSLEYQWRLPGTDEILPLPNPFNAKGVRETSVDFVAESGERKPLSYTSTQRFTFESIAKTMNLQGREISLFLYDDVKAAMRVTDERMWNIHLYPYFPSLSYDAEEVPSELLKSRFEKFSSAYQIALSLEDLAQNGNYEESKFKGFRLLQLAWKQKKSKEAVEALFYDVPVTKMRPFMRILPSRGNPVLKVHLKEDRTPDLADIRLLKQWTKERNPVPEHDFLLGKVLLKEAIAQQPPLYMTLRLTDITADATILPPKGIRKLDFVNDLPNLVESFTSGIEGLSLEGDLQIAKATLNYRIDLNPSMPVYTKKGIRRRLAEKFLPFFEEIESLPGEPSLITLRYRAVNNYASEGRIFAFLTQYLTRKDSVGEGLPENIVEQVANEFKIDNEEAERYVTKWVKNRGKYDAVENSEFVEVNNTGIEISIIAQHPWYHVNLSNVDTLENLRRILMLLTILLMTADADLFTEDVKAAAKVYAQVAAEERVQAEREEKEEEEALPAAADAGVEAADNDALPLNAADMGDFGVEFGGDEEEEVRKFVEEDKEVFEELPPRPALPLVPPPPPPARNENEESVASATTETGLADFFLTKLKEADKRLFDYTKTHPSLKKYVSMCAANVTRQPAVVSVEQFNQMREVIYREDLEPKEGAPPRINFVRYPLEENEKAPTKGAEETFFFLHYGTTPQKDSSNYYVCSKYFCTRDNLILIEGDFKATRARTLNGKISAPGTKKENSCPFCGGIQVRNRRNPGANETVLVRQEAPKTKEQFHTHVGFLKKTPHPERDIYLPCCFLKPQTMRITDEQFTRAREFRKATGVAAKREAAVEEGAGPQKILTVRRELVEDKPIISNKRIQQVIARTSTHYIIGSEKLPLEVDPEEGAQIGLCPPEVDMFFGQSMSDFVTPKNPHKLKPDAKGFLRIGVENRVRFKANSFLAAVAPYYFKETAREMQNLIYQSLQLQPALFFQLNYGNFLLEWFSPSEKQPDMAELARFLEGEDTNSWGDILQLTNYETNPDAAQRFYVSWHRFEKFLYSGDKTKEYRQFAGLFAQPNFILRTDPTEERVERPGITFIIINIREDKTVDIQCPPYGFNNVIHGKNDIAFLLHHYSGIWEPLYYVDNQATQGAYTLFFQKAEYEGWPQIVRQRVAQFMSGEGCASDGKLSYPAWPEASLKSLLTTSRLRDYTKGSIQFHGMLRDTYNHLSALLFESPENPSNIIPIPCADNGALIQTSRIYLSRENLNTAHPSAIREFYENYLLPMKFPPIRFYAIKELWYSDEEREQEEISVLGMFLENRVFVPLQHEPLRKSDLEADGFKLVAKPLSALTWLIDEDIVFEREEEDTEEFTGLSGKELQDIFEHLRLSFSKFLLNPEFSGVAKNIWNIVESDEILQTKREQMEILLGPTLREWFTEDEPEGKMGIRRIDCLSRSEEQCTGRCAMNEEGQCAIHAPEFATAGKRVLTVDILLFRLFEELLRFPERRRELLENDVSFMKVIEKPVEDGDQYIIPENSPKWYELLQGEWMKTTTEKPIFFEEMSSKAVKAVEAPFIEPTTALPESLITYLGKDDPKTATFRLYRGSMKEFLGMLQKLRKASLPAVAGEELTQAEANALHKATKYPIGQIDIRSVESIKTLFSIGKPNRPEYFILVLTPEGPALLVRNPAEPELPKRDELPSNLVRDFQIQLTRAQNNATRRHERPVVKKRPVLLGRSKSPAPPPA